MGWLHSSPPDKDESDAASGASRPSRIDLLEEARLEPDFPDIHFDGLVDYFLDAGPVEYTAMGPASLSSAELTAWTEGTKTHLSHWDFAALLKMSRSYLSEKSQADAEIKRDPPFVWPEYAAHTRRASTQARLARRGKETGGPDVPSSA